MSDAGVCTLENSEAIEHPFEVLGLVAIGLRVTDDLAAVDGALARAEALAGFPAALRGTFRAWRESLALLAPGWPAAPGLPGARRLLEDAEALDRGVPWGGLVREIAATALLYRGLAFATPRPDAAAETFYRLGMVDDRVRPAAGHNRASQYLYPRSSPRPARTGRVAPSSSSTPGSASSSGSAAPAPYPPRSRSISIVCGKAISAWCRA
jgi:hypothetical protein